MKRIKASTSIIITQPSPTISSRQPDVKDMYIHLLEMARFNNVLFNKFRSNINNFWGKNISQHIEINRSQFMSNTNENKLNASKLMNNIYNNAFKINMCQLYSIPLMEEFRLN